MDDNRIRTPWGRVPLDVADLEQLSADLTRAREMRDFDALNTCTHRMRAHYEAALVLGTDAEMVTLTEVNAHREHIS